MWDRANRLLALGGVSYAYNGDGNRVAQTSGVNVMQYLLDLQPGLTLVLGDSDGNRYVHAPRGIHAVNDGAAWTHPLTDGLGSVRGYVDTNNIILSQINYSEYGVPDVNISGPAFTGEWRSENETQYHRARHLSPGLATWLSLDPFEGLMDRPLSLNGYAWVEGQFSNATDASGMFSCSAEDSRVSTACSEFDRALQHAQLRGLAFDFRNNVVSPDSFVDLKELVRRSEQHFGLQLRAAGTVIGRTALDLIDLDDCTQQIVGQLGGVDNSTLAKEDVLRAVAAMVYISSKFTSFGNGVNALRGLIGNNSILFFGQQINSGVGIGEGFVEPAQSNRDILLTNGVTIATIVHELGHAIDRATNDIPRRLIATPGLLYSSSQARFLRSTDGNIPGDALGLPLSGDQSDGMLERANPIGTAGEVWADVFMTWVLNGVQTPTSGRNPSSPGWDCTGINNPRMANMWNTFAGLLMAQLVLRGGLSSSNDDFLHLVAFVTHLSPLKPCS